MPIGEEMGRKLSVQSFGWTKDKLLEAVIMDKENDHFLMRVFGKATDLRKYTSRTKGDDGQFLEGYGVRGVFECTGSDGEIKQGELVYLPGYITDGIVAAMQSADDVEVEIALDVYARWDKDSSTSYIFVARSLTPRDNSAIDAIKKKVGNQALPSLPAPAKK